MVRPAALLREARTSAQLSVRELGRRAGMAASTVHRIERGRLEPTVDTLARILQATGLRLALEVHPDTTTVAGLARAISQDLAVDPEDRSAPIRRAAELVSRFEGETTSARRSMVANEPPPTGDHRWDALVAALVEWLTVRHGLPTPCWAHEPARYLAQSWWVTTMPSLRAWEYAGTPASFQQRGVYLHRDSLRNV